MVFHHVHCREWYCKFMNKKWFYNGHNDYAGILAEFQLALDWIYNFAAPKA